MVDLALSIDNLADKNITRLRRRLGTMEPFHIVPYRTYGTPENIYVRGRVLEDKEISKANEGDDLLKNLLNMYKRFETDEVAGATVLLDLPVSPKKATTDKEGYFVFNFRPPSSLVSEHLYHRFTLRLTFPPGNTASTEAEMMVPPPDAEFGIISDIDDTNIRTGATSLLSMGKTVLMGNARTRLPFPGVSAFYKGLQLGRNGKRNNPFFYVSSSPWNLYDLLIDFMDHNEIPHGPLLLRDFGLNESFMSGNYLSHKFKEIAQILDTYPHLNFMLVGDSGEQDPPIYLEVVKKYPGRIICIYIRDVIDGAKRAVAENTVTQLRELGVEMLLTLHSVDAAIHAASIGLIYVEEIPAIIEDKKEDTGQLPGKEETAVTSANNEEEIREGE